MEGKDFVHKGSLSERQVTQGPATPKKSLVLINDMAKTTQGDPEKKHSYLCVRTRRNRIFGAVKETKFGSKEKEMEANR